MGTLDDLETMIDDSRLPSLPSVTELRDRTQRRRRRRHIERSVFAVALVAAVSVGSLFALSGSSRPARQAGSTSTTTATSSKQSPTSSTTPMQLAAKSLFQCSDLPTPALAASCERIMSETPTPEEEGPNVPHVLPASDEQTPAVPSGTTYAAPWKVTNEWQGLTGPPNFLGTGGNTMVIVWAGAEARNLSQGVVLMDTSPFPVANGGSPGPDVEIPFSDSWDPTIKAFPTPAQDGILQITGFSGSIIDFTALDGKTFQFNYVTEQLSAG